MRPGRDGADYTGPGGGGNRREGMDKKPLAAPRPAVSEPRAAWGWGRRPPGTGQKNNPTPKLNPCNSRNPWIAYFGSIAPMSNPIGSCMARVLKNDIA